MADESEEFKGFGAKPTKRAASERQMRQEAAASRYDEMAARGMPEYSVWIRLKEPPRPDGVSSDDPDFQVMPWLPVGSLAVPRSSQIANAIYEAEDDLLQGAFKLYPNMQNEERSNFEYGFQNKQFPDEEVRLAVKPVEGGIMGAFSDWVNKLTNPINAA